MTDHHPQTDIVIVGGGLVGATLALALTRLYPSLILADRAD